MIKKFLLFLGVFAVALGGIVYYNVPPVVDPTPTPQKIQPQLKPDIKPDLIPPRPNVPLALRSVFEQAERENKKVLLFLTMDGCVYCEKMKRDVLPKTNLNGYILFETKDQEVITKYQAHSFPTFVILDKTALEVKRHTGYQSVLLFQRWLGTGVIQKSED